MQEKAVRVLIVDDEPLAVKSMKVIMEDNELTTEEMDRLVEMIQEASQN